LLLTFAQTESWLPPDFSHVGMLTRQALK
jgi:hypothetical protein